MIAVGLVTSTPTNGLQFVKVIFYAKRTFEMLRTVVVSQIVQSVGYDDEESVLEIQFRNGWIYQYDAVPKSVFHSLMSAASHGRYLKRHIVDKYPTRRIQ